MPSFIIKLNDYYLEWSTIVDAPTTFGMSLEEFTEYYQAMYGEDSMRGLQARLDRVKRTGTSALDGESVDDLIRFNRAGPNEKSLKKNEIYRAYCLREQVKGWKVPEIDGLP